MDLQKFISFACAHDASRAQANRENKTSDKPEQGQKSSSSRASYKEKLKGKRPNESFNGQPSKKPKRSQDKQKQSDQKARDWEANTCFYCHKRDHKAKECPDKPKRADFQKAK
jgi:cytochrome c553